MRPVSKLFFVFVAFLITASAFAQSGCREIRGTGQTVCFRNEVRDGVQIQVEWPTDGKFYHRAPNFNRATFFRGPSPKNSSIFSGQGAVNVLYLGKTGEGHLYREVWYYEGQLMRVLNTVVDDDDNILMRR